MTDSLRPDFRRYLRPLVLLPALSLGLSAPSFAFAPPAGAPSGVKADITINKNMVPFDDKSPFVTSGIRIGSAAVTTRGLGETDMHRIVELIDETLTNHDNDTRIGQVRQRVNAWLQDYPLFA